MFAYLQGVMTDQAALHTAITRQMHMHGLSSINRSSRGDSARAGGSKHLTKEMLVKRDGSRLGSLSTSLISGAVAMRPRAHSSHLHTSPPSLSFLTRQL